MASKRTFKGGVHPLRRIHHGKYLTENCEITPCTVPDEIVLPLSQHIGAPSEAMVAVGDKVDMGQMIAKEGGFVGVPVYSSVSGTVTAIEPRPHLSGQKMPAIVIENDGENRLCKDIAAKGSLDSLEPKQIIDIIQNAGIVGLGGAAFPTHVKLSPPPEKPIDTVIVNGAECEPYLTADHRVMLEYPQRVVSGLKAIMKALNVKNAYIAIEDNKRNAIKAAKEAAQGSDIGVVTLKVKYPQGAEKQLIQAVSGRQVPSGKLPMDVGAVVVNAGTAYQIALAIEEGMPLYERVVTVTGGVNQPGNLSVRLGTPLSHVISRVGGFSGKVAKVIAGGPMMGITQKDLEAPVIKGTSGILVLDDKTARPAEDSPCMRCGKCVDACPMGLEPYLLNVLSEAGDFDAADASHARDCIECGCCSYTCPANRYLVHSIRLAKTEINNRCKIAK